MDSFLPTHYLDTDMETIPEFISVNKKFTYRRKTYKAIKKRYVPKDDAYCITTAQGPLWLRPNEVVEVER